MNRIITLIALMSLVVFLPSCQDRFRYSCQDPANWESAECKKPECSVTRTCPDLLLKEKNISTAPVEKKTDKKGDCK
jgi:hypothetical protein